MSAHSIELVVRGRLWPSINSALGGFAVDTDAEGLTTIVGPVVDQSEVLGLLEMFNDLNIEVVSLRTFA
jgi:hypothetical protein